MRTSFLFFLVVGLALTAWWVPLSAVADQAEDETTIRALAAKYVEAYNRGDAKTLASLWSPDGIYENRDTGEQSSGREMIESEFAEILTGSNPSKLDVTITSISFLSPTVAIEQGTATLVSPDADGGKSNSEETTYSAVHVKRDGTWLLDRISEGEVVSAPSHYPYLSDLEWLVGEWVDETEGATVETSCQWTRNQNFLRRSFTVKVGDQVEMSGIQLIGWDPSTQSVRSWVFDSDGGFGEATWTKRKDRWVIESVAVLPDGGKASSINIMAQVDDSTMTWQATGREVDGEILPNLGPITLKKSAAESPAE
ncbi:YybH family protein [Aeoliella sp. SH292]|uniref:YybH family protein n=1 Tax=Aeoliella sp. SH292 TaxID=3454464 RepID=UPI003F9A5D74